METEEDNYYDNDYKSNKIKEIIIIENQDTTYKYKY